MQTVMEWLQAIGSLLTMGFGIFGVGVKPRNDMGQLTREGQIVAVSSRTLSMPILSASG
jgi:hypothetical protein